MSRIHHVSADVVCQGIDVAPDMDFELVNSKLGGYSGDDITNICRDAAMNGMRRKIAGKTAMEIREMSKDAMKEPITTEDFLQVGATARGERVGPLKPLCTGNVSTQRAYE